MGTKKKMQRFTISVDVNAINYFKKLGTEIEMPYHTLVNMYLKMCAKNKKRLSKSYFK